MKQDIELSGLVVSLITLAIGLVLVFVVGFVGCIGYLLLTSHLLEARQKQQRLEKTWGRENDQPPPWDQPVTFDDAGPQWRKDQFETLMSRLTIVKSNDHDDYLFRRE